MVNDNDDEDQASQELARKIQQAWDRLPEPPAALMAHFRKCAQTYDLWRVSMGNPPAMLKELMGCSPEELFNSMSVEERVAFQVTVHKLLTRPSANPIEPHGPIPSDPSLQ